MCLKNKKILVTGALGFIGRTLLESLIDQGCGAQLYGIDIKKMSGDAVKFRENVNYTELDIRDETAIKNYIQSNNFDGIVHLAAVSRVIDAEKDKQNCIDTNYKGTKYIAESAANLRDCWMIFGSSREVYGEQKHLPVAEDAELLPLNIYGFYKLEGERIVRQLLKRYCVLRFSNVYGNAYDIPDRVIPKFVRTAQAGGELVLEGGEQIIDFTHIDDTVASIMHCIRLLQSGKIVQETIHILPGVPNKITDIIGLLRDQGLQFTVRTNGPRSYDVQRFVGSTVRREQLLGKRDFIELKEGLRRMLECFRPTI